MLLTLRGANPFRTVESAAGPAIKDLAAVSDVFGGVAFGTLDGPQE